MALQGYADVKQLATLKQKPPPGPDEGAVLYCSSTTFQVRELQVSSAQKTSLYKLTYANFLPRS